MTGPQPRPGVKEELGLPNAAELTADLHSLLVYETNQHFVAHQDSEKDDRRRGAGTKRIWSGSLSRAVDGTMDVGPRRCLLLWSGDGDYRDADGVVGAACPRIPGGGAAPCSLAASATSAS